MNSNPQFGIGRGPTHIFNVKCSGSEIRIDDCHKVFGHLPCIHYADAGVRCQRKFWKFRIEIECKVFCCFAGWLVTSTLTYHFTQVYNCIYSFSIGRIIW